MAKGAVQAKKKKARKASKERRDNRFFRKSKSTINKVIENKK